MHDQQQAMYHTFYHLISFIMFIIFQQKNFLNFTDFSLTNFKHLD